MGSSIRLGVDKADGSPQLYVICNTDLIDQFKQHYPDRFTYHGKRAVSLKNLKAKDHDALHHCIAMGLTYKLHKRN